MKVLFVLADNIYLTPYLNTYTSVLKEKKIDYDVFYWDKNNNEQEYNENQIRFLANNTSIVGRVLGYFRFHHELICTLKENKYDFIICLHTVASLILFRKLLKDFKGRYFFDVRDYSYEKYWLVRHIEKHLVANSALNVISSPGYVEFLPKATYQVIHNIPRIDVKLDRSPIRNFDNRPIVISYIGLVRFIDQNKRIIDYFANDMRFELRFIGTNSEVLRSYCEKNQIKNVKTEGTFAPGDTIRYFMNTDLIMNLYGNHTPLLDYALSNKLYYSAYLYRPILVCKNTYMEKISIKHGFGFALDISIPHEKEELLDYIHSLQPETLINNCDQFMDKVVTEHKNTMELIGDALTKRL